MGIVNITPDSFSDGGNFLEAERAIEHAISLEAEGADILDLGAESTRPGSQSISPAEQLRRLLPVLQGIKNRIKCPISIDTTNHEVAEKCLQLGASIINDVTGFHKDKLLPKVCAAYKAGVILMHMPGSPETMQQTSYVNLLSEVKTSLAQSIRTALENGVAEDRILIDPGLGFGKSFDQNYELIGNLKFFSELATGILVGPSRKAFTGEFSKLPANQRQFSTSAAVTLSIINGADIIRVHDIREMKQAVDIADKYKSVLAL